MNRIAPDEIDFHYEDGKVVYAEAAHIKDGKTREQVKSEVQGGIALLWENVRKSPDMDILQSEVIEEEDKIWAKTTFVQDVDSATASIIKELSANLVQNDPELFVASIMPIMDRIDTEEVAENLAEQEVEEMEEIE